MVLDRSKPDAEDYDVLHIDLNADADLTGPGERLTPNEDGRFRVADFKDPATGVKHPNFNIRITQKAEPTVMLSLRWRNQFRFGGGYSEDPDDGYLRFVIAVFGAPSNTCRGRGGSPAVINPQSFHRPSRHALRTDIMTRRESRHPYRLAV